MFCAIIRTKIREQKFDKNNAEVSTMYIAHKRHIQVPYIFLGKAACILVIIICSFLIVLFFLPAKSASAGDVNSSTYTITSVHIQTGDTLWSIAKEYYSEEFSSVPNLVIEIKRMNGLSSDTIYAGNYILVPQYTTETVSPMY